MLNYEIKELDYNKIKAYSLIEILNSEENIFFLDSAGIKVNNDSSKNRSSYIAIDPIKEFKYYLNDDKNIFEKLKEFFTENKIITKEKIKPQFLFYFSYDLGEEVLNVKNKKDEVLNLPDIYGVLCKDNWYFDHIEKKLYYIYIFEKDYKEDIHYRLEKILNKKYSLAEYRIENLKSNFTYENYKKSIESIKEHILDGDVYQINLSQMFTFDFYGSPLSFYKKVRRTNPAPFSAYVRSGDNYIISSSPERFVYKRGKQIYTEPIKGTRPRGNTSYEDEKNYNELKNSLKERTENVMIVDLLRNDIGKISEYGTVKVDELFYIEKYSTVFQLISKISGDLKEKNEIADIIRDLIPGGSISGCPKKRAVELIAELEPVRRGLYTGCLGRISCDLDEFDFSILIRTILIEKDRAQLSLGGGITIDSDPHMEYLETIDKGIGILEELGDYLKGEQNV